MSIEAFVIKQKKITTLFIFLLTFPAICIAGVLTGRVVSIADGDTITVLADNTQHKIRLSGIDAPEKSQAFGNQSKQSLSDMVFNKIVNIDFNKTDRYRRIVGKVTLDNKDINLEQIKRGLAWHYKKYEKEQDVEDRSLYAQEEYLASKDKRGLWSDPKSMPPWEYRKMR